MRTAGEIAKTQRPGAHWHTVPANRERPSKRVTLDSLEITSGGVQQMIDIARAWAKAKNDGNTGISAVFCGGVGTGKTHVAKAILWSSVISLDGVPVAHTGRFYHAHDLITTLDAEAALPNIVPAGREREVHGGGVELVPGIHVLVIDDVGSEGVIPFVKTDEASQLRELQARYFRVLDYCYERLISVVITSNLTAADLEYHLGPRSWSRLQEMAPRGFILELGPETPDYRRFKSGRA